MHVFKRKKETSTEASLSLLSDVFSSKRCSCSCAQGNMTDPLMCSGRETTQLCREIDMFFLWLWARSQGSAVKGFSTVPPLLQIL